MPFPGIEVKPVFVCCYQGVSDYTWNGKEYEVRSSCDDWNPTWNYTPGQYEREVVPTVGTIMNMRDRQQFPPVEIEQFFPGYVRARFRADWSVEYANDVPPEVIHSDIYKRTLALPWAQEMRSHGTPVLKEERCTN